MRIPDYEVEDDNRDGMMPCPDCEGEGEVEDDNRQTRTNRHVSINCAT